MKIVKSGESIEANEVFIVTRKLISNGIIKDKVIGLCLKLTCEIDVDASIEAELNPKVPKKNRNSHLDYGDNLICYKAFFLSNSLITPTPEVKKSSHKHKGNQFTLKSYTYGEISFPFKHIENALNKRQLKEKKE